jgi:hypothetical protein
MNILHMSLHGALMLEGLPTLMLTGQKNVLVKGPTLLTCPLLPKCFCVVL